MFTEFEKSLLLIKLHSPPPGRFGMRDYLSDATLSSKSLAELERIELAEMEARTLHLVSPFFSSKLVWKSRADVRLVICVLCRASGQVPLAQDDLQVRNYGQRHGHRVRSPPCLCCHTNADLHCAYFPSQDTAGNCCIVAHFKSPWSFLTPGPELESVLLLGSVIAIKEPFVVDSGPPKYPLVGFI